MKGKADEEERVLGAGRASEREGPMRIYARTEVCDFRYYSGINVIPN